MWYKYRGQVRPHKMEKDKPQNSPREIIDHIHELRMPCRDIDPLLITPGNLLAGQYPVFSVAERGNWTSRFLL